MYRACHVRARLCNPEKGGQRGGTRRAGAKGGAPVTIFYMATPSRPRLEKINFPRGVLLKKKLNRESHGMVGARQLYRYIL
jgi:hypothetical protein